MELSRYPEPTVSAIIFNPDNEILLCKSSKWNNEYVIPGGHIETGERMEEALRREIKEETGLSIYDIRLIGLQECISSNKFHTDKHFIFIDYTCRTDSKEVLLNDEAQEFIWIKLEDAYKLNLGGYTGLLIKELINQETSTNRHTIFYNYVGGE
ncbi:MAG: NUDIX domain-containing protein [Bacteroidota bacterium]|nr:NUDIX domain-containing protein [Bacteroidota bacterium]MDP4204387.1 NUDIX domain-containing protein [Bacteroidota bacterium]